MAAPDAERPHEHRWRGVEFYLEDDHPFLLQSCECGETRAHKAWERYWDPAAAPLVTEAMAAPDTLLGQGRHS